MFFFPSVIIPPLAPMLQQEQKKGRAGTKIGPIGELFSLTTTQTITSTLSFGIHPKIILLSLLLWLFSLSIIIIVAGIIINLITLRCQHEPLKVS